MVAHHPTVFLLARVWYVCLSTRIILWLLCRRVYASGFLSGHLLLSKIQVGQIASRASCTHPVRTGRIRPAMTLLCALPCPRLSSLALRIQVAKAKRSGVLSSQYRTQPWTAGGCGAPQSDRSFERIDIVAWPYWAGADPQSRLPISSNLQNVKPPNQSAWQGPEGLNGAGLDFHGLQMSLKARCHWFTGQEVVDLAVHTLLTLSTRENTY